MAAASSPQPAARSPQPAAAMHAQTFITIQQRVKRVVYKPNSHFKRRRIDISYIQNSHTSPTLHLKQSNSTKPPRTFRFPKIPNPRFNPHRSTQSLPQIPTLMSSPHPPSNVDPITLIDAPNKGYELSGKIMLSAVLILFAVVIFMIFLHLYARWHLLRARRRQLQRRNRQRRQNSIFYVDSGTSAICSQGLDSGVMKSLPVFEFNEDLDVSECAVCLSEFVNGAKGRSLPKCNHSFHIECIDMWFASHSTCPLCRAPVEESVVEIRNKDEESRNQAVVVVDSVTRAESESVTDSTALASTSSFGVRRELKGFSVEIPTRTEPCNESPGGRMMSLRRILTRGLSMSSPVTVEVCSSGACCDLEMGVREETSREPSRAQSVI